MMRRMCSAHCSIEEGGHNKEGKQLKFIQHDAGLLIATVQHVLGDLQSLSDNLRKGAIADCFEC